MLFFFSSRRRHTRLQGDWSSDVCSSDLRALQLHLAVDQRVVDGFGGKRTQDLARRGAGRGRGVTAGTRPLVNGGATARRSRGPLAGGRGRLRRGGKRRRDKHENEDRGSHVSSEKPGPR